MEKAAKKTSYRIEFYKRLLEEKLVVITQNTIVAEGIYILEKDTKVSVFKFTDGRIPIFTSTDTIFDKKIIKNEVNFLELKGRDLFAMLKGATLILNPYSDYGKELLPEEIEGLLNDTFLSDKVTEIKITEPTNVRIGQPAKYPTETVKSLKELFSKRPKVNAAYVAWIQNLATNEPPHYIFVIDVEEDWRSLSNEAGYIAQQILGPGQIIDFMEMGDGGINDYIKSTEPFYKK